MRIVIAAVGKARAAPEDQLAADYLDRAQKLGKQLGFAKIELSVVETSRASDPDARMAAEAQSLRAKMPKGAHVFALDERGKNQSSENFAQALARLRDAGRDIVFLIGGPDGLAGTLREGANERLSFGSQTWPHLMARAMLSEQIYRAMAILARHPYHRGH